MMRERFLVWTVLLGFSVVSQAILPARAGEPLPEFYGLYAIDNGSLIELQEAMTDWPGVGPDVRFVAYSKGVALGAGTAMQLNRMMFHRKTFDPDESPSEQVVNNWYIASEAARNIELRAKSIPGQPEMVMFVPREPLVNGAYALRKGNTSVGHVIVGKAAVTKNLFASADCVDRIYEATTGVFDKLDKANKGGRYAVVPCSRRDETQKENVGTRTATSVTSYRRCSKPGGDWRNDACLLEVEADTAERCDYSCSREISACRASSSLGDALNCLDRIAPDD